MRCGGNMECHLIRLIPLPGDSVNVLIARNFAGAGSGSGPQVVAVP